MGGVMSGLQTLQQSAGTAATAALIVLVQGCAGATNGLGASSGDASTNPIDAAGAPLYTAAGPLDAAASSPDATTEAALDASLDGLTLCLTDAPLLSALSAMANDSDGAAPGCLGCIVGTCSTELDACGIDCTCNEELLAFATCATDGGTAIACAAPLATSTDPATATLAACVGGGLFGGSGPGCLLACANIGAADGSAE
jgi:hypothetical protein